MVTHPHSLVFGSLTLLTTLASALAAGGRNTTLTVAAILDTATASATDGAHSTHTDDATPRLGGPDRSVATLKTGIAAQITATTSRSRMASSTAFSETETTSSLVAEDAVSTGPPFHQVLFPDRILSAEHADTVTIMTMDASDSLTTPQPTISVPPATSMATTSAFMDKQRTSFQQPQPVTQIADDLPPVPSAEQIRFTTSKPPIQNGPTTADPGGDSVPAPGQPALAPVLTSNDLASAMSSDPITSAGIVTQLQPGLVPVQPTTVLINQHDPAPTADSQTSASQTTPTSLRLIADLGTVRNFVAVTTDFAGQPKLAVGSSSVINVPTPPRLSEVFIFAGQTFAAQSNDVTVGDKTLTPGQSITVGSGASETVVGVTTNNAGSVELVVGGSTTILPTRAPIITTLGLTLELGAQNTAVVNGQTIPLWSTVVLSTGSSATKVVVATNSKGETVLAKSDTTIVLSATNTLPGYTSNTNAGNRTAAPSRASLPSTGEAGRHEVLGSALLGVVALLFWMYA